MPGNIIACTVIRLPVKTPKAGLAGISEAGRKLVAQESEQPEHSVTGASGVRHDFGGVETGLLLKQAFEDVHGIPQRPWYDNAMKPGLVIRGEMVVGDASIGAKVFAVRAGIEGAHGGDEP
jgi:hypothetical protein